MSENQVVVVGAGPAGLSSALALKDVGIRPLLLDQAEQVGTSWRSRYDRLRLNTCRPNSHLPDRRFPKGTPMFPTRDQVVEHLERHAREDGIQLQLGTAVHRVDRSDGVWSVETSAGELRAPQVVVATGHQKEPFIPAWVGRDGFQGELLHSCQYRNSEPFREQRVLVVGPGCSGMEIAYDLGEGGASKVWLSARTPPNIVLREGPGRIPGDMLGVTLLHFPPRLADAAARFGQRMGVGDLTEYGLPVPEEGVFSRLRRTGLAPAIVDKEVIEAIKAGRIEIVPGVDSLDATGVRLADGARVEPEAVICATGYQPGLEPLVGHLEVLDERGMPRAVGERPAAPGLRFAGYVPRPGQLGYMGREAKRIAKMIQQELLVAPPRRERQPSAPAA
jgi:cation diffusion facilitator CzcD-associated flavoprotein CzcO